MSTEQIHCHNYPDTKDFLAIDRTICGYYKQPEGQNVYTVYYCQHETYNPYAQTEEEEANGVYHSFSSEYFSSEADALAAFNIRKESQERGIRPSGLMVDEKTIIEKLRREHAELYEKALASGGVLTFIDTEYAIHRAISADTFKPGSKVTIAEDSDLSRVLKVPAGTHVVAAVVNTSTHHRSHTDYDEWEPSLNPGGQWLFLEGYTHTIGSSHFVESIYYRKRDKQTT